MRTRALADVDEGCTFQGHVVSSSKPSLSLVQAGVSRVQVKVLSQSRVGATSRRDMFNVSTSLSGGRLGGLEKGSSCASSGVGAVASASRTMAASQPPGERGHATKDWSSFYGSLKGDLMHCVSVFWRTSCVS